MAPPRVSPREGTKPGQNVTGPGALRVTASQPEVHGGSASPLSASLPRRSGAIVIRPGVAGLIASLSGASTLDPARSAIGAGGPGTGIRRRRRRTATRRAAAGTGALPRRPTWAKPRWSGSLPPGEAATERHRGGTRQAPRLRPRRSGCPRPMSGPPATGTTQRGADTRTPRLRATSSGTRSARNSPAAGARARSGPLGRPPRDPGRWEPVPPPSTARPRRGRTSRTQSGHRRGTGRGDPRPGTAARPRDRPAGRMRKTDVPSRRRSASPGGTGWSRRTWMTRPG